MNRKLCLLTLALIVPGVIGVACMGCSDSSRKGFIPPAGGGGQAAMSASYTLAGTPADDGSYTINTANGDLAEWFETTVFGPATYQIRLTQTVSSRKVEIAIAKTVLTGPGTFALGDPTWGTGTTDAAASASPNASDFYETGGAPYTGTVTITAFDGTTMSGSASYRAENKLGAGFVDVTVSFANLPRR